MDLGLGNEYMYSHLSFVAKQSVMLRGKILQRFLLAANKVACWHTFRLDLSSSELSYTYMTPFNCKLFMYLTSTDVDILRGDKFHAFALEGTFQFHS